MSEPALTEVASAVLSSWMAAGSTQTLSASLAEPSLPVDTSPRLWTCAEPSVQVVLEPPVAAVVDELMWTVKVLRARVVLAGTVTPLVPPQVSTPRLIAHLLAQPAPPLRFVLFPYTSLFRSSVSLVPVAAPL